MKMIKVIRTCVKNCYLPHYRCTIMARGQPTKTAITPRDVTKGLGASEK